ncbi:hypothetical protein QT711_07350 [Sporosarcina saromensis]|uniref:SGNH/GDSL hydrolase family protein n=1 Tax=Sporosarcina saromensis TaxID=359365 RepID=A0ABU4G9D4_9BACL|nr:hypothetical protein [Sporosarcina saromensis]MDW0112997.1 hypothetical protein [Sporosarcina saromensis]
MKIYRFIPFLFFIICISVLIYSYLGWKSKLENVLSSQTPSHSVDNHNFDSNPKLNSTVEDTNTLDNKNLTLKQIESLSRNMDSDIAQLFITKYNSDETLRMLLIGSTSLEAGGDGGAAGLTKSKLKELYGDFIDIDIIISDGTSQDFIDTIDENINWNNKYDLLIIEPFTLNNNGKVVIEDEHQHILMIDEHLKRFNNEAVLIITPSQPILKPNFYLLQINTLKQFALENEIHIIDHWDNWPDVKTDELLSYLNEESLPNSLGAKAWADALLSYFIGE